MRPEKREHPKIKPGLHPRNRHRERYDFKTLINSCPELSRYVRLNEYDDESIDFFDPSAVKMLNKALLKHYYNIENWDIPEGYLCPPIPGRADYIHHIADLLAGKNQGIIPTGKSIKCLDTGVGANCVYPLIGNKEYGWSFTGTETDTAAIESANKIILSNPFLLDSIEIRWQENPQDIFKGVIRDDEHFDLSICNPPFHASRAEAQAGTLRKLSNITHKKVSRPERNFGGQSNELWSEGGEEQFIGTMIRQSRQFAPTFFRFSTLVSKESTLEGAYGILRKMEAMEVNTIPMGHGQKSSRILTWTFLSPGQQESWIKSRWDTKK